MFKKKCLYIVVCFLLVSNDSYTIEPDTLSVLAVKQYLYSSSEEFYQVITGSGLTEPQRDIHQCRLIKELFKREGVFYDHANKSPLMQLNALSDSIQYELGVQSGQSAVPEFEIDYHLKYLVKPVFADLSLTIYQIERIVGLDSVYSIPEISFVYIYED